MPKIKNNYSSISDYINYHWKRDNAEKPKEITFADETWCISDDIIGKGCYASIHLAIPSQYINDDFHQLMKDRRIMAVKSFFRKELMQEQQNSFEMFYKLHSPYYPVPLQNKDLASISSINNEGCYLLLPLFPGSLKEFHNRQFVTNHGQMLPKYFSPVNSLVAIIACLRALLFFHTSGHAHLDIKMENIQYDDVLEKATVIDPDFATKITAFPELNYMNRMYGSLSYHAPEIYESIVPKCNFRTDYYAMAGLIIELLGNTTNDVISLKTDAYYNNRSYKVISITPYHFRTEHLKKHFSDEEIENLLLQINNLSHNDHTKRPENLNNTIQFFETLLESWLSRHKTIHQEKMKHVFSQFNNHFFKNNAPELEEEQNEDDLKLNLVPHPFNFNM